MFALYITHPQVRIDPSIPVPQWGLSDIGRARAEAAAASHWAGRLGRIISSAETKAIETAEILARRPGLTVEVIEATHENDRSTTGFLPPPAFEEAANWFFAHPTESFNGWERAVDAQTRMVTVVESVLANHDPAVPIAFVGHGGVGTLLKCHLSASPIARDGDQPPGGGNLYALTLPGRRLVTGWIAMDTWDGALPPG